MLFVFFFFDFPSFPLHQVFNSVNLGQIFVIAVIASAIWWQSENVSDIAGAMFFISIQQAFNGLNVRVVRVPLVPDGWSFLVSLHPRAAS